MLLKQMQPSKRKSGLCEVRHRCNSDWNHIDLSSILLQQATVHSSNYFTHIQPPLGGHLCDLAFTYHAIKSSLV